MDAKRWVRDFRQGTLVELARAGSESAFCRLYGELYDPVVGYVARRVRRREDVEDLTGQVFLRLVVGLERFDAGKGSVWTWVMTLARNTVIDHFRTHRVHEPEEVLEELAAQGASPLDRLIESEERQAAIEILRRQPAEIREMFLLRFADGLRYGEIAALLGTSEAAVKQRFSRTLRQLRLELGPQTERGGEGDHATWDRADARRSASG